MNQDNNILEKAEKIDDKSAHIRIYAELCILAVILFALCIHNLSMTYSVFEYMYKKEPQDCGESLFSARFKCGTNREGKYAFRKIAAKICPKGEWTHIECEVRNPPEGSNYLPYDLRSHDTTWIECTVHTHARSRFNAIYLIHELIIMQMYVACPLKRAILSDISVSILLGKKWKSAEQT